jgi:hypothetical protein
VAHFWFRAMLKAVNYPRDKEREERMAIVSEERRR